MKLKDDVAELSRMVSLIVKTLEIHDIYIIESEWPIALIFCLTVDYVHVFLFLWLYALFGIEILYILNSNFVIEA